MPPVLLVRSRQFGFWPQSCRLKNMNDPLLTFRKITVVIGSTLIGACIGFPLFILQRENGNIAYLPLVAGILAGYLIGNRKKESHIFFFFVLFAIVTLGGILLGAYQGPTAQYAS
jgi:uncharacterized membrane protein YjjP (DUF1212 family)